SVATDTPAACAISEELKPDSEIAHRRTDGVIGTWFRRAILPQSLDVSARPRHLTLDAHSSVAKAASPGDAPSSIPPNCAQPFRVQERQLPKDAANARQTVTNRCYTTSIGSPDRSTRTDPRTLTQLPRALAQVATRSGNKPPAASDYG